MPNTTLDRKENKIESPRLNAPLAVARETASDMLSPIILVITKAINPAIGPEVPIYLQEPFS